MDKEKILRPYRNRCRALCIFLNGSSIISFFDHVSMNERRCRHLFAISLYFSSVITYKLQFIAVLSLCDRHSFICLLNVYTCTFINTFLLVSIKGNPMEKDGGRNLLS